MYQKLLSKNIEYFGPEGVIMYSKSRDYYNINQVAIEDIQMFYTILSLDEELPGNINRKTYLSCCLFYLSKNQPKYIDIFSREFIQKLKNKDKVDDTNLFLIFNIIEFYQRYLDYQKEKIKSFLNYLEKFANHKKTPENDLLYKYYSGLLKYLLGRNADANAEHLRIIIGLNDQVEVQSKYIDFIALKNQLFKVQLDLVKHVKSEYYEQYCFMKELYNKVKLENKKLCVKLGFCLYTILCRQNKLNECIPLLMELKKTVKNEALSGIKMKISIDYYLAILSRMGYIGTLIGDKKSIEYAVKKLLKILNNIEKDKNDKKLSIIYNAYSFILSILNFNLDNYDGKIKEKASMCRYAFIRDNMDYENTGQFIVDDKNLENIIINLNSINNMDYAISESATKIIEKYIDLANRRKILISNQFLTFVVGMHDIISRLSESYCTDDNKDKRSDYIAMINNHAIIVFNYVSTYKDNEPLLETDFVKSILINIQSALVHSAIFNDSIDSVKEYIQFFDDLSKKLNINENNTSYELINKIKGDYWFKLGDYKAAIFYYEAAINKFKKEDPKRSIVYFNLGCSYYFSNNKRNAFLNYNKCINSFSILECEKETMNILKRQNTIQKKVKLAKDLIMNMGTIG